MREVAAQICVADNVVPDDLCDAILAKYRASTQAVDGRVIADNGEHVVNAKAKISRDWDFTKEMGQEDTLDKELYRYVDMAFQRYVDTFRTLQCFDLSDTGYFLSHYPKDRGFYDWHLDASNASTLSRIFSLVLYLNTVKEGGETRFYYQHIKVPTAKGRLVLFPSFWTHMHRGEVPRSEDKYIMTTFFHVSGLHEGLNGCREQEPNKQKLSLQA